MPKFFYVQDIKKRNKINYKEVVGLMQGKQQDFRTEKYIRYGIRKYSFGAASVAIAAGLMFLGNGAVSATEVQGTETSVAAATAPANQADSNKEKEAVKPETKVEEAKPEVKVEDAKKVNKAILEASIATLESKLSTAKYADATVVSSAKEVLATAKATLAKADASQADVDAQAETVSALSTVVTESNTAGFDKKQAAEKEAAKAEAEKTATPVEKALSVATTTLTQVSSEAEVTNKLAETELAKADVKEENKAAVTAAVAKNQAVLTETKALLADKSVTKEQVDAQLERLNESILAVYNELKNAGINRDGKFAVNLADAQTTPLKDSSEEAGKKWLADRDYESLADVKVKTKLKEIAKLNDQIQWIDLGDTTAWKGLKDNGQLQVGSQYEKELIPGYKVKLTVKSLKPFHSTEIYKNRVAGTDYAASYEENANNAFNPANGGSGIGAAPQNRWTEVKSTGIDTGSTAKTTLSGTNDEGKPKNGTVAGVVFDVEAEYNGKKVQPGVVMTSGEQQVRNEVEIYTTNGTPWELAGIVGKTGKANVYQPGTIFNGFASMKGVESWLSPEVIKAIKAKQFITPDSATAGLGSQVFGPYINDTDKATPIVSSANVSQLGFYIMTSGAQSSMIGIKFSDFGDLPESYGIAEHYLKTQTTDWTTKEVRQIQQPYLGKVKADIDSAPGTRVIGVDSDDTKDTGDEGVDQLISPDNVHTNKDTGRPEVQLVRGPENTYKVKVLASANGNDNYNGTVEPAYVRGFIDFNGNGKFDKGEESTIATVTGNNQEVELTFKNTQVVDTSKNVVNFRVRIATEESQVEKPIGIAYSGEVEDNHIQVIHPPRGDYEETTGKQGEKQNIGIEFVNRVAADAAELGSNNGKTTFNAYGKISYAEENNSISLDTTKKVQTEGVMIVNPDGSLTKTFTKAGQGTYEVTDTGVTFTPEANFVGKADGIVLRAVDSNGESTGWTALTAQNQLENINDGTHTTTTKTMDAVYIPTVTPKEITADPETSTDVQGKEQKKTPTFKTDGDTATPVTPSATYPAKLVDPETGDKVDSVTVEGEGTYKINPTTGEVTFQPLPTFKGTASGVDVTLTAPVGQNKEGQDVTATATTKYTPTVTAVEPTAKPTDSAAVQGETQKGTPTFTAGNAEVPIKENSHKLLDKEGNEVQPGQTTPAYAEDGVTPVGTYSIDPATGEVTFTPTDKTYTGKVTPAKVQAEDKNGTKVNTTYTPHIVGVKPTSSPSETTDVQGVEQSKEVSFAPGKVTIEGVEKEVPIDTNSFTLLDESGQPATSVPAKNPAGDVIGNYTLKVVDGKPTAVFTPTDKTYSGEVEPVTIQAKDTNGTPVTTTYTPKITPVEPTGKPVTSEGAQGQPQEGTPTFTQGDAKVPMKIDATQPAKLIDPATGNPTDETTIPAKDANGKEVGTYTIDPTTGKVTFTPNKDFVGTPVPATVQAKDANGTPTTATYKPTVKPVTPKGVDTFTKDIQGAEQKGTPEFKPGKVTIDGKEVEVPIDTKEPAKLIDPKTGQPVDSVTIDGEGTYTVDPETGEVTFKPDPQFTGKGTPIKVQRKDTNGTPVTGDYTAVVVPADPEGDDVTTADIQGAEQSGKPQFHGGKAIIDNVEKEVPIDENVPAKLIDPTTGQEVDEVVTDEGTYRVDPNGTVHFKPKPDFVGKAKGVTVQRRDTNGSPATGTFTPTVVGTSPKAEPANSSDIQGQTQEQPVKFTGGSAVVKDPVTKAKTEKSVDIDPKTYTLLNENGQPAESVSAKDPEGNVIGTYTLKKEPGKDPVAVFTPTNKTYAGKVQPVTVQAKDTNGTPVTTTYTPNITPVKPTAKGVTSEGAQGQEQSGTPTFTEGHEKAPIDKTVPAKLIDPETGEPTDETSVEVPGEGTYTINPETGEVTFKPEPNFTGKAEGVEVQRKDTNGTPATAKYTPTVKPVTPTSKDQVTTDVQGATQTGKPVFTPGTTTVNGVEKTVELSDKPAKLVDPKTGDPVDSVTIEGEGTYTVAPDGTVTFTPNKDFTGQATGVTVKREDTNGTPVTAKYTPVVLPVTPSSKDVTSIGEKGKPQSETPVFTAGTTKVNGKTVTVLIDETVAPTLEGADKDGKVVVPGEGTYTIDKEGKVTFTPEPNFVGKATGVTVKRVDENGTPVTATYTPTVLGKTTTENVVSDGAKGQPQSNTPVFKGDVDTTVAPTFKDGSTEKKVPGEGTYTIDKDGKVTFTPEPNFVGTATPVKVVRKDKNGRTIKATYTPTVHPDTKFVVVGKDGKETEIIPSKDGKKPSEKISGYKLVKTETDEKGNTKHIYEPVTTKHVDRKGNPIPGTTTEEGTKDPKNIPGYKVVETKKLPNGDTEYVYEKVTTSFVDTDGHVIEGTTTEEGTTPKKDIPGYKFVETRTTEDGDTEHVYEKVKTSFKDKDGNVIPGTTTEDGEQPKKDIPGYKFVETKTLPNGDTEHVYEKVTTTFKDKDGNLITVDKDNNPVKSTEEGEKPKKDIPGYRFVETKKLPNGDIEHVYEKVTTPTPSVEKPRIIARDTEGKIIPGFEFDMLSPILDIPEYEYVGEETLPDGTIKRIYKKVKGSTTPVNPYSPTPTQITEKVLTTYVDENGELIISDENGSHPGKPLEGYELVRTETDANGNVRNVYRKVQSQTPAQPVEPATPAMPEQPAKPEVPVTSEQSVQEAQATVSKEAEAKRELPNTGTEDNASLAALGLLGVLSGFGLVARKKKED